MDRFVAKQNVEHFCTRLRTEPDPMARTSLQHLLVEEENKLGFDLEQLAAIEREIAEGSKRVARQQALVEQLEHNGQRDAKSAQELLRMLRQTMALYEQYRLKLMGEIDANGLLAEYSHTPGSIRTGGRSAD